MLFKTIPSLPPSYSQDTIDSIHFSKDNPFYSSSTDQLSDISQLEKPLDTKKSTLEKETKKPSHQKVYSASINAADSLNFPSTSPSKGLGLLEGSYNVACSLDVELSDETDSLSARSDLQREKQSDSPSIQNSKTLNNFVDGLIKTFKYADRFLDLENEMRNRESMQEKNLHSEMNLTQTPSTSQIAVDHLKDHSQKRKKKEKGFEFFFRRLASRLHEFEEHMKSNAMNLDQRNTGTWVSPFASHLLSIEVPTEEDILHQALKLVDFFQAQIDTLLITTNEPLKLQIPDAKEKLKLAEASLSKILPFSSSSSSFLSNSNLSLETASELKPICTSCIRLRNSLEAQTHALTRVNSETKMYDVNLTARLQRIETSLLTQHPLSEQGALPFATYLPIFESSVFKFIQSNSETIKNLKSELKCNLENQSKLETQYKLPLQKIQNKLETVEKELQETKKNLIIRTSECEKQSETSKNSKAKTAWMKQLMHQLEHRVVEETLRHKSTKKVQEQLQLKLIGLTDANEKLNGELVLSKDFIKKQSNTIERQTRQIQLMKNKKNEIEEDSNSRLLMEECLQSLEVTKLKLCNEQKLRQRSEARVESLKTKIDDLQKEMDAKDKAPEIKDHPKIKKNKQDIPCSNHVLNQYKLAIADFIQWLYTSYQTERRQTPILTNSKVSKKLVDRFSKMYLHMPYDELLREFKTACNDLPSKELASIFSSQKNIRQLLSQFLQQCTKEILDTREFSSVQLNLE